MAIGSEVAQGEYLSALADGELDAVAAERACIRWRDDPEARAAWHAYHLIGDVLRSDEFAVDGARDAVFVRQLRVRLAQEPVVLAPRHESALTGARWAWMAPLGVAAGFMAVASALVLVARGPAAPSAPAQAGLARAVLSRAASIPVQPAGPEIGSEEVAEAGPQLTDGRLVRDARLDFYLAAHDQLGGTSALDVRAGFLRSATTRAPSRWEASGAPP